MFRGSNVSCAATRRRQGLCQHLSAKAAIAAAVLAIGPVVSTVTPASGAVRSWVASDGNWSTPGNWSTGLVPQNTDEAVIAGIFGGVGRSINYDYAGPAVTLSVLRLSGGITIPSGNGVLQTGNVLTTDLQQIAVTGRASYSLNGGTNSVGFGGLFIGNDAGSRGAYFLSGSGVLTLAGETHVGVSGTGTFNQSGGTFNVNGMKLAENVGSTAVYDLSNGLLNQVNFNITAVGMSGMATFTQSGGTHLTQNLVLGSGSLGRGTYALSGTASLNGGSETIGNSGVGTFIHSGGTNTASGLIVAAQTGSSGIYTLSGSGVLEIVNGFSGGVDVGSLGAGTFIQTGGTHSLVASNNNTPELRVGSGAGGSGTYLMSGGTLNSNGGATVGTGGGTGLFNQSGGTHNTAGITLGAGSLSAGTYVLGGTATLNSTSFLTVGKPGGAQATFLQTGGTHNLGTPGQILNTISATFDLGNYGATGSYVLSGGTLNVYVGVGAIGSGIGGVGTFEQTGGTFNFQGLLGIGGDLSGASSGGNGTYRLLGGRLNATPVSVGNILTLDGVRLLPGGIFEGGPTDGVVAGKFTQSGGTVIGVLRNEGNFVYTSGAFNGQMINRGTFTIDNTTFTSPMNVTNDDAGIITGAGTIAATIDNRGTISPTGAMTTSQPITSSGLVQIGIGSSFIPSQVSNLGQIRMAGGVLGGSGSVSNNVGGTISGGGTISAQIVQNGGVIRADNPTVALTLVTSPSTANASSQLVVAPNATMKLQNAYTNSAIVALQGAGATLGGATVTNNNTIRGAGQINNVVLNNATIRAENGELRFTAAGNVNASSGRLIANSGATISFDSGLANNSGTIQLLGGGLDNGAAALANSGAILGRGMLRAGAITNTGSIVFTGGVSDVFAPVNNHAQISVTGNGAATFYDTVNAVGTGSISVSLGSNVTFMGQVSGLTNLSGQGTKDFEGLANFGGINASGTTIVGAAGNVTAGGFRDNTLQIFGRMAQLPNGTPSGTCRVNTLLIAGSTDAWTGRWDLADNDLVIDYIGESPLAAVKNQIKSGFNNGAFNGNGITTSSGSAAKRLGYAEASALGLTLFSGQAVDPTSVVVKFTFAGDANLDGQVDVTDLGVLATHWQSTSLWTGGDFNYDGFVDVSDLGALATNWQAGVGSPLAPSRLDEALAAVGLGNTSVPEPTTGAFIFSTITAGLLRRSRVSRPRSNSR
jgi:hypothetical protein